MFFLKHPLLEIVRKINQTLSIYFAARLSRQKGLGAGFVQNCTLLADRVMPLASLPAVLEAKMCNFSNHETSLYSGLNDLTRQYRYQF
jgi:hypothetical protein